MQLINFSGKSGTGSKAMNEFNGEALGFDVENVIIPEISGATLDKVEGAVPSTGQKTEGLVQKQADADPNGLGTAEDIFFISDALLNLPTIIWTKLPERDPEKIKIFNKEFHRYCVRKGINPWDYFFAEFGMAMAALPILVSYGKDYNEFYKKDKTKKEGDKLNLDHEHKKEVDDKQEVEADGN